MTALACMLLLGACRRSPPPNIIVYVVDTLRADAIASYGNPAVRTPSFDRLAAGGTRFVQAYANASWTRASMGSLLTGEYPSTHGAVDRLDVLRGDLPRLPSLLRRRGYRTAAIIANPNIGQAFGFADGFDDFTELYQPGTAPRSILPQELIATADRVVDSAIDWLDSHGTAGPFFLFVFSIDPHAPYTPPPPYDTLYDRTYTGGIDGSLRSMFGLGIFGKVPPEREIRHLRALYDGEVAFNDAHLGRLLDSLDRLDLTPRTLFVATSDHGEEFYEHGGRDHGHTLYEELIRVPLVLRWPGTIAVQPYREPVQLADLFPTLLRFAGTDPPTTAGRDLSPVLTRGGALETEAYAELDLDKHHMRALVRGKHKLITEVDKADQYFDLSTDPYETPGRTASPAPELLERLRAIEVLITKKRGARGSLAPTQLPEAARRAMEALGYLQPTPE
jgi:arylsulfatase A-like enzyme